MSFRRASHRSLYAIIAFLVLAPWDVGAQSTPQIPHLSGISPDLDGVWDGMFQAGGDTLSVAFTIAAQQDKTTTITVDILEQHAQDIPVDAASVNGAQVHFDVPALQGTFDGAFTPDRGAIQGTWIQLGKHIPLTIKRRVPGTAP